MNNLRLGKTIWLMMVCILVQSISTIAGTLDTHVYDPVHVQTGHDHQQDHRNHINYDKNDMAPDHDIDDCHHCGHCSGTHLNWLSGSTQLNTAFAPELNNAEPYTFNFLLTVNELLRPPIS